MPRFRKIVFWVSIGLICFWILLPIIDAVIPLEFTDYNLVEANEVARFYGLPLAILLTLLGTTRRGESAAALGFKVISTIIVAILCNCILTVGLFIGMCRWIDYKILFENKRNATTKIILRGFGCGATDSTRPDYKMVEEKNILPYLIWVQDVDTTKIDLREWARRPRDIQK